MIQLQVLNYILESKDSSIISDNNLNKDFFSDYKSEFEFIYSHFEEYGNIPDKETFLSKFLNFDIIEVKESKEYLLNELYKDKNNRYLVSTFNKVRQLLMDGKTEEALSIFLSSSEKVSTSNTFNAIDLITDDSRYDAYLEQSKDFAKYYIPTGFKELDQIIGGWDRQEDLVTIVARNGVGKSWALLKTALAAAERGLTVGFYSGEMSARMVGYRADTLLAHLSNTKLIRGNLDIQNDYKKFLQELPTKVSGHVKVLTPDMVGGFATVSTLRMFIEKENLDILCIDQHSLLEDDFKAKNPIEKASNISKSLKTLQSTKRIPIITVSQQNRSSTENGMSTALISQSDRIGQDSTIVIFLEQKDGIMTVDLVKSRFSASNKKLQYVVDFDKGTFEYVPTQESINSNDTEVLTSLDEQLDEEEVF